jgi:hypothetical protein
MDTVPAVQTLQEVATFWVLVSYDDLAGWQWTTRLDAVWDGRVWVVREARVAAEGDDPEISSFA